MISPSPIEHHIEIARAIGSRTGPLDQGIHRGVLRRLRRNRLAALDGIQAPIVIRSAADADGPAIDRLGLLDGHRLPAGERLVAETGGQILAAAEIASGATIADPFKPTGGIVRLVAMRAEQLRTA